MAMGAFPVCHWSAAGGATKFNGQTWFARQSDLVGNADSKLLLFSFWFNPRVAGTMVAYGTDSTRMRLFRSTADKMQVTVRNAAGGFVLELRTSASAAIDTWHHIMGSVDLNDTAKRHLVLNDVADMQVLVYANSAMDFTRPLHLIAGSTLAGGALWDGCLEHIYLNFGTFMDLSVVANKRKFIKADLTPADLGTDGSAPTGSPPIVYLRGNPASIVTNRGTGGDLPLEGGTLLDCADEP